MASSENIKRLKELCKRLEIRIIETDQDLGADLEFDILFSQRLRALVVKNNAPENSIKVCIEELEKRNGGIFHDKE